MGDTTRGPMKIQDMVQEVVAGPLGLFVEQVLPPRGCLEGPVVMRVDLTNGYGLSLSQYRTQVRHAETELMVVRRVNDPEDDTRHDYSTEVTHDVVPYATVETIKEAINTLRVLVNDPHDLRVRARPDH